MTVVHSQAPTWIRTSAENFTENGDSILSKGLHSICETPIRQPGTSRLRIRAALIVGRVDTLHLHSECAVCVDSVTVQDNQHKDLKASWKALKHG